ncbi:MAG TPA: PDZ domain-containing protein [Vicinamibacterales bacterium]|nr:PDZ domain-containing protein [Vicinamibacterales bacterium]
MSFPGSRIFKAAGVLVVLMGAAALVIVAAPLVHGQATARRVQAEVAAPQVRTHWIGGSYIGVTVRDADRADADRARLAEPTGAVVDEVRGDSPASAAGLRAGDLITRFDGERVRGARHFERLVSETPDGRNVEMTVVRAGENVALTVAPEASPAALALDRGLRSLRGLRDLEVHVPELRGFRIPEITVPHFNFDFDTAPRVLTVRGRLGVSVQEMGDQLGEYFGAPDGLLVTAVEDDSPASAAGIRAGDVITGVAGNPVRSSIELRRRLDRVEGDVTITVVRDRKEQTLTVTIEDRSVERVERPVRRIIR